MTRPDLAARAKALAETVAARRRLAEHAMTAGLAREASDFLEQAAILEAGYRRLLDDAKEPDRG
jgi:hypothetical protein